MPRYNINEAEYENLIAITELLKEGSMVNSKSAADALKRLLSDISAVPAKIIENEEKHIIILNNVECVAHVVIPSVRYGPTHVFTFFQPASGDHYTWVTSSPIDFTYGVRYCIKAKYTPDSKSNLLQYVKILNSIPDEYITKCEQPSKSKDAMDILFGYTLDFNLNKVYNNIERSDRNGIV